MPSPVRSVERGLLPLLVEGGSRRALLPVQRERRALRSPHLPRIIYALERVHGLLRPQWSVADPPGCNQFRSQNRTGLRDALPVAGIEDIVAPFDPAQFWPWQHQGDPRPRVSDLTCPACFDRIGARCRGSSAL